MASIQPTSHHLTQIGGVSQWTLDPESSEAKRKARQDQRAMERDLLKQAEQIVAMRVFY